MLPKFNCRKSDCAMDEYLRIFKGPLKEMFAKNLCGVRLNPKNVGFRSLIMNALERRAH